MSERPVFSIIVPIYNVEAFLKGCIESVLNQDFRSFELILVDDGSPDESAAICDDYERKDERVTVIHKANGGLVSARNAGLQAARGDYIFYLDGDDQLDKNAMELIYEKGISSFQADMVVFNMSKVYTGKTEKLPFYVEEGFYTKEDLENKIYPYMMWDYRKPFYHGLIFPSAGGKVIKRSLLLEHYCSETKIKMGEDNAYIFECALFSNSIYFLPESLYLYNQLNEGSFANSYDAERFENNQLLISYLGERIGKISPSIDRQLNAFQAYWLIMAIFHEVKAGNTLSSAKRHVSAAIKSTQPLKSIDLKLLPLKPRAYLCLIKLRLYRLALIGARIINHFR